MVALYSGSIADLFGLLVPDHSHHTVDKPDDQQRTHQHLQAVQKAVRSEGKAVKMQ